MSGTLIQKAHANPALLMTVNGLWRKAMADDEEELEERLARLEMKFNKLSENFTQLRHEVNELERKIDKRT